MGHDVGRGTLLAGPLMALSREQQGIAAGGDKQVGRLHGPRKVEQVRVLADEGAVQALAWRPSWSRVRRAESSSSGVSRIGVAAPDDACGVPGPLASWCTRCLAIAWMRGGDGARAG